MDWDLVLFRIRARRQPQNSLEAGDETVRVRFLPNRGIKRNSLTLLLSAIRDLDAWTLQPSLTTVRLSKGFIKEDFRIIDNSPHPSSPNEAVRLDRFRAQEHTHRASFKAGE